MIPATVVQITQQLLQDIDIYLSKTGPSHALDSHLTQPQLRAKLLKDIQVFITLETASQETPPEA